MSRKINELINQIERFAGDKGEKQTFIELRNFQNLDVNALDLLIDKLARLMGEIGTENGELNPQGILIDDLLGTVNQLRIEKKERKK
jgi:hypothetical protein